MDNIIDAILRFYRRQIFRRARSIKYWFLYRFHPNHRYHVLKIGKPGYSDPRHCLITAMMAVLKRYIDELRHFGPEECKNASDLEVIEIYLEDAIHDHKHCKWMAGNNQHMIDHYKDLYDVWSWWVNITEDGEYVLKKGFSGLFDDDTINMFSKEKQEELWDDPECVVSYEEINEKLKKIIDLRGRMWT